MDRRRRVRLLRGGAAAAALLLAATIGVLAASMREGDAKPASYAVAPAWSAPVVSTSPVPATPAPTVTTTTPPAPPTTPARSTPAVRLPSAATFEMAATAGSVTVRSQNLGADLYRVTLGRAAGPVTAKVTDAGSTHRLTLVKDPDTTAPPVTITLNNRTRWSLRMTAGNRETTADLTGSRLAALELAGGAHLFTLSLPPVSGTLPVRVTHSMNQLKVKTNGLPVRLTLRDGAGQVVLDGVVDSGVDEGSVLTSDGWSDATDRVDLDSLAGVGTLSVNPH